MTTCSSTAPRAARAPEELKVGLFVFPSRVALLASGVGGGEGGVVASFGFCFAALLPVVEGAAGDPGEGCCSLDADDLVRWLQ